MKLIFPVKVLDQHLIVLGKTGAGKSSALRHIAEWLLAHNKRVCVIDPKGDWYGLKASADGKGPGFPVVLFGDFKDNIKGDVPLIPHSQLDNADFDVTPAAKHVAELVVSGNRPCVIGMRGWTQGNMTRFWIEFAPKVFNSESGELYLINDEIHNFAPKGKVLSPDAGKSLHWTNRLINEGRGIGLMMFAASQRPQKVHNDTLDACETLIAMRVVHPAARKAIKDWLDGAGDKSSAENVYESLAGLERGEAIVWSPEIKFGPQRLRFPMFETYDSFAPPKLQKKVSEKGWATVDLTEVREKLASVIAKAKAEDPKELQKEIASLRKQIAKPPALQTVEKSDPATARQLAKMTQVLGEAMKFIVKINAKEFTGDGIDGAAVKSAVGAAMGEIKKSIASKLTARDKDIQQLRKEGSAIVRKMAALTGDQEVEVNVTVQHNQPFTITPAAPRRMPERATVAVNGDFRASSSQQRILDALAWAESIGLTEMVKTQLAVMADQSPTSGGYFNNLGALRTAGLLDYPSAGNVALTDAGRTQANSGSAPATNEELHNQICAKLSGSQTNILRELIASYPDAIKKDELAERVGQSPTSGGYFNNLGRLRTLKLIDYPQSGYAAATSILFIE